MLYIRIARIVLLGFICIAGYPKAICINALAQQNNNKAQKYQQNMDKQRPKGKLYQMAKKTKKEHAIFTFLSDRSVVASNIRELARRSTEIIMGRVLRNRAYLNDEGDEIHKFINVFVQDVFKGAIVKRSGIEVRQLGGSWLYNDGTALSWYPADALVAQDGKSYIFFLIKDENKEYYIPSLGVQSIFEIDFDTRSITPADLFKGDPVVIKYHNAPLFDFLNEIKSAVSEEVAVGTN